MAAGLLLLACMSCLVVPVCAQEEGLSEEARSVSITVYNSDLGLVKEVRTLRIPSGTGWVRFRDVPARIDATSVHLKPVDGQALSVLEQNYEYDLISPQKLLERHLDSRVKVMLEEGRLYEGRLLSAREGELVLGGVTGEEDIVIISRDKVSDIHFAALPQGLITRPTLAWLLSAQTGGEREVEVSYLTSGTTWHAEYVAVVSEDDGAMDLAGWVSVQNRSGATYPDAQLQLVAGDLHRVSRVPSPSRIRQETVALDFAAEEKFEEESFFEYHLYTLARRTTLRDNETKQISLFDPATCDVTKLYEANPRRDRQKVRVVLETANSQETGLGMPLPKGKVRVYKRDRRGQLQFIGEDRIDHTPRDEEIRVLVGKAFDLVVERTELATRKLGPRDREADIEIEVRNRKEDEDVTIVVQEDLRGFWEIRDANMPYEQKSSTRIEFAVAVKAGETETVAYTVRYTW
jgi:hypothetical protein